MPQAKRPLAEVDGNTPKEVPAKHQKISMRAPLHNADENDENDAGKKKAKLLEEEDDYDDMLDYKTIDYTTKDNSKLQCLLRDRNLPDTGTRAEMIKALQHTAPDYESFTTDELTEKLYNRHLHTITGTKQTKIARLLLNDHLDRHSGNSDEGILYGRLWSKDDYPSFMKEREDELQERFQSWTEERLRKHLEDKGLSTSGSKMVLIKNAMKAEKDENNRKLGENMAQQDNLQAELDSIAGHHVAVKEVIKEEHRLRCRDHQIQEQAKRKLPNNHICDYDWSESPWASKSEIELQLICLAKGMPGLGFAPKAAQMKWLDTGNVNYSNFYISGLKQLCEDRGVYFPVKAKKQELIDLLEASEDWEDDGGWEVEF